MHLLPVMNITFRVRATIAYASMHLLPLTRNMANHLAALTI